MLDKMRREVSNEQVMEREIQDNVRLRSLLQDIKERQKKEAALRAEQNRKCTVPLTTF